MTWRIDGVRSILLVLVGVGLNGQIAAPQTRQLDYLHSVKPILAEKCYVCHGPGQQNSGLRLDQKQSASRVFRPEKGNDALLVLRITNPDKKLQMPPIYSAFTLTSSERDTLVDWVRKGAPWPDRTSEPDAMLRLFEAVDRNKVAKVRGLLQEEDLANREGPDLATPLMHAALNAGPQMVDLLLKRGAKVNASNPAGATALIWAASNASSVSLLLAAGADVNATSKYGITPLIAACAFPESNKVVRLLLSKHPKLDIASVDGDTPLVLAASTGDVITLKLLLAAGADPHFGSSSLNPLSAAAYFGNTAAVQLLLDASVRPDELDGAGGSALHPAVAFGRAKIVELLLSKGADVNKLGNKRFPSGLSLGTPLMMAAYTHNSDLTVTKLLLRQGADSEIASPEGETVFSRSSLMRDSQFDDLFPRGEPTPVRDSANFPVRTNPIAPEIREEIENSLALLQRSDDEFVRKAGCMSCHNQHLSHVALAMAGARGLRFDKPRFESEMRTAYGAVAAQNERNLEMPYSDGGVPVSAGYALFALSVNQYSSDAVLQAYVRNLAARQLPQGQWHPAAPRPPIEFSDVTATALAIRALRTYAPERLDEQYRQQVNKARTWLRSQATESNEDAAFRLLGLRWSGIDKSELKGFTNKLLQGQRPDGGWAQISSLQSDAYATGQALFALHEAGNVPVSDARFRRGINFLRTTQHYDGSWLVHSRTLRFMEYFDSGFPHGRDQFVSAASTGWATIALILAVEQTPAIPGHAK